MGGRADGGCAFQAKSITLAELDQIIFSNKLGKEKGHESFWSEISESSWSSSVTRVDTKLASSVQLRPIIAVYHHVRRARHPFANKGTWTKTEDDLLVQ